jgi:glycerol kinase
MSLDGYLLSIDQGTTSSRALICDINGNIISQKNFEFKQYFPNDGWVEHDPIEILKTTQDAINFVIKETNISAKDINIAGITNQRETVVAWNKLTGKPVYNAIVWQDRRTENFCATLREKNLTKLIQSKTGLIIDSYFSATKIKWIIENIEEAKNALNKNNLLVGTIDSWLIWNFTKGECHYTDVTNASRTMLYNINEDYWDDELLNIFNINKNILPDVKSCVDDFGVIDSGFFGEKISIGGVAGDQQAATIGQACFKEGMVKSTYGTGCFLLMNTGNKFIESETKLLSTKAYNIFDKKDFALEGSIFNAGTVVQWMRDEMNFINDASKVEDLAKKSTNEIQFIPAFTGLGAPYWNSDVRGQITGITRDTSKADIAMAALKSVCYQTRDLLECLLNDSEIKRNDFTIRVDGGMSKNNLMMQFLSDITQVRIERPLNQESTALGAAYLAGMKSGVYKDVAEVEKLWKTDRKFKPTISLDEADQQYNRWLKNVKGLINNG